MAEQKVKLKEVKTKLPAARESELKSAAHAIPSFQIVLPRGVEIDDVTDPALYTNVARRIPAESEIRLVAEDGSFVAWVYVSYSYGNDLRCHLIKHLVIEDVKMGEVSETFSAKLCGRDRWCIVDNRDGSRVKQNIANKMLCLQEIIDYEKALRG